MEPAVKDCLPDEASQRGSHLKNYTSGIDFLDLPPGRDGGGFQKFAWMKESRFRSDPGNNGLPDITRSASGRAEAEYFGSRRFFS